MPPVHIAMVLLVYGIVLWLIDTYVPRSIGVKPILSAVVVLRVAHAGARARSGF